RRGCRLLLSGTIRRLLREMELGCLFFRCFRLCCRSVGNLCLEGGPGLILRMTALGGPASIVIVVPIRCQIGSGTFPCRILPAPLSMGMNFFPLKVLRDWTLYRLNSKVRFLIWHSLSVS